MKLFPTSAGTVVPQLFKRSLWLTLLLVAAATAHVASAQNIQLQPVARLITDPVTDAKFSRPRTVAIAESTSNATKSVTMASPSFDEATEIERRAFEKTNLARVQNSMAPLSWDPQLCRMARIHSERMAQGGFFSHQTPDGFEIKERAHQAGVLHFRVIGENIAYNKGYDDPGGFAVERWMISSGHRANILYSGFQASAIGSYVAADGSVYVTQVFITR